MTAAEARERATMFVYCECNLGDIIYRCERAGIPTKKKNGKLRSRTEMECDLIELYASRGVTE